MGRRIVSSLFLFFVFPFFAFSTHDEVDLEGYLAKQRETLLSFYETWEIYCDTKKPMNEWKGVVKLDQLGRITHLSFYLTERRLRKGIPASLKNLTSLRSLQIYSRSAPFHRVGYEAIKFPQEIFELKELRELELTGLNLQGEIPERISELKKLRKIHLYNNAITAIPSQISELEFLEEISLFGNNLTAVPEELGEIKSLERISLQFNQIPRRVRVSRKLRKKLPGLKVEIHSQGKAPCHWSLLFSLF